MSNQKDIFISYCSNDYKFVKKKIYQLLQKLNVSAWFDKNDILPGQEWNDEIKKGLKECKLFLACIGKKDLEKTKYQKYEIYVAIIRSACKQCDILPVLISDSEQSANDKIYQFLSKKIQITKKINKKLFYAITRIIKERNDKIIEKLHHKSKKTTVNPCEEKLEEMFNNARFNKYRKYLENAKKNDKKNDKKILKILIIGKKEDFDLQKKYTRDILGKYEFKELNKKKSSDYEEQEHSDIFWEILYSDQENKPYDPNFDKHKLIKKMGSNNGYVFVSYIIERETKLEFLGKQCEFFINGFETSEKYTGMKLFFCIYTTYSIPDEYIQKNFNTFDYIQNNFTKSNGNEKYDEETCLQELVNFKNFVSDDLNNPNDLFKKLKKLICYQEEDT